MKITIERLRQLIKEEVENVAEVAEEETLELFEEDPAVQAAAPAADPAAAAPQPSPEDDSKKAAEIMTKISKLTWLKGDYASLLVQILQMDVNGKKAILNDPKLIKIFKLAQRDKV
jgi:3-oxoacyl-ACP reductase-like protein